MKSYNLSIIPKTSIDLVTQKDKTGRKSLYIEWTSYIKNLVVNWTCTISFRIYSLNNMTNVSLGTKRR